MTIEEVMNTKVVTVEMDDSLEIIKGIFEKVKFHHLLVVSHHTILGVISDRDLLKGISPFLGTISETTRDRATLDKRAHQIMSRRPVMISKNMNIEDGARLLLEQNVSCLPVVSAQGQLEGIVTWKDIFRAYLHQQHEAKPERVEGS